MANLTIDPQDGTEPLLLNWQNGLAVLPGPIGLGMPPRDLVGDQVAHQDGIQDPAVVVGPRDITVPLDVWARDRPTFLERRRRLQQVCSKRTPLKVTYEEDDGTRRWITGYYVGGLEGDGGTDRSTSASELFAVKIRCADPWWYGPTVRMNFGLGAGTPFFPFFPLRLSPSSVQGEFTVDLSDSDEPASPVWTVVGPGSSLILANVTTGRSLTVNAAVAAGDSVIVDTRPGKQSVRRGDGTNLGPSIVGDPDLWPLINGVNKITVTLADATSASRILGECDPRYAGI